MQGMISSPHLSTTLIFDVSRRWSLYLNRCVAASASESLYAPGVTSPSRLRWSWQRWVGGQYVGPILPVSVVDLVHNNGGRGSGGGSTTAKKRKYSTTGGGARVRAYYDAHLPVLSLRYRENSRSILAGAVFPNLHGAVICNNWHLCGVCWEDC